MTGWKARTIARVRASLRESTRTHIHAEIDEEEGRVIIFGRSPTVNPETQMAFIDPAAIVDAVLSELVRGAVAEEKGEASRWLRTIAAEMDEETS